MADIIQAQYEQLESIAARFGQQAEAVAQTIAQERQAMDSLQQGGWIGQGAEAFFAEMDDRVLPGMQRLSAAIEEARSVTLRIKEILQQAEEEACSPFGGSHSGAPAGVSATGPGATSPGGVGPGATGPGPGPGSAPGSSSDGDVTDWLADRPMIGFRLFGVSMGTKNIIDLMRGVKGGSGALRAVPIAGGIIGTVLGIMDANARGENMDFAVGREITKGTFKTEVYLVPGLNVVAGGFELAHMFGLTDTNYTDTAVNAIAEPVHKYALDPASDILAEGIYQADRGIRAGARAAESAYDSAADAFSDGVDYVKELDWPW